MRIAAPLLTATCLASLLLIGCNGGNKETTPAQPGGTGTGTAVPATGGTPAGTPTTAATSGNSKWEVRTDSEGRKWFGDVPYDVFFDDPLGVANNNEAVIGMSTPDTATPPPAGSNTEPKTAMTPEAPETADTGWGNTISAEALDAEVKTIRNFLNPKLQSVGQYNPNLSMIAPQAATLAALAGIAAKHEGDISWKADALYIRDLAGQMVSEPLQRGPKFQRRLLGLYEQISDTLNRSRPADLPEPDAEASTADSAEMGLLMQRMQLAYNEMKTNAGSEGTFQKSLELVQQESAVVSALAKLITEEGYGYEDDDEFKAFAKTVADGGKSMIEATALKNFAEYDKALSATYNACNNCHLDYK